MMNDDDVDRLRLLGARPGSHRVSSSLLGPVDSSFRAFSGRLKFTVRRHKFNKDSLSSQGKTDLEETDIENQGLRKLLKLKERVSPLLLYS